MKPRVANAAAFAVEQNSHLPIGNVQHVQHALIGFAVAGIGFLVLVVTIVAYVGIPVRIVILEPCCKNKLVYAKLSEALQTLLV